MDNDIKMIPIELLRHHPNNPRSDLGDLTELADSILAQGVLQNLTVIVAPDSDFYWVVIGNRRYEAAKIAGLHELPCRIAQMDEKEAMKTMISENMHREDLTVYDQIQGIGFMQQLGMTLPEIAQGTGMSEVTVRKRATIGQLPKKPLAMACEKGATLLDLLEVAKLDSEESKAKVLSEYGTNNFQYSLNQAIRNEKIKTFMAALMPKIEAAYPGIKPIKDADSYNGRWKTVCQWNYDSKDEITVPAPKDGEKYAYREYGWGFTLREENKAWVRSQAQEKENRAYMKDKKQTAIALNKEAWELRGAFVRKFSLRTAKERQAFYDLLFDETLLWRSYRGVGYYKSGWDANALRGMLAIPREAERDEDETFEHELERRGVRREAFILAWAVCGGIVSADRSDDGYCNNYNGLRKLNEDLDSEYRILTKLGYEMSDFEKQLQDGTHEFFRAEGE